MIPARTVLAKLLILSQTNMNVQRIVKELEKKYPGKNIVLNTPAATTEIICETLPGDDYSEAIAVVDSIRPHYHKELTETYEILKG